MEQDNHPNQYANGICCQLKKFPKPEYGVVPFTCQTREGVSTKDIDIPSTISCEQEETLVSCGIKGLQEIQGTYINPMDPNTCIVRTSSDAWGVTAVANCC